ncbi:hypothetical protein [Sphingomonas aerophila]|uniref:Uncharacterized protein n=1 Tax=Sphingomonas aerophila TaxID=1344948 RepID=A0A7W9BH95_9SPHN|nr:hypothetical protein [Sphingomonas aerophila]MBB5716924.1 hypothetical protein [Sphingomonas aerophila]
MDIGLGSPGMYLLLAGGLATGAGKALARRDVPTALALGIAAVLSGQAAGLAEHLLAVAWTVVAVGLIAAAGSAAVRWLTGARAGLGAVLVVTSGMMAAMATHGASMGTDNAPLTIGVALHHNVATLIGFWSGSGG